MASYSPYNTGTAAAGGKGGTMGGFGGMGGKGGSSTQRRNVQPGVANTAAPTAPPTAPAVTPMPQMPTPNEQGPNAFETGLNAQNGAMDFFQNAMGGNQGIMDMISSLGSGGSFGGMGGGMVGGGGGGLPMMQAPSQDMYDYNPAQVSSQGYQAQQLSDKDISQYMNPYTRDVIDQSMADLGRARDSAMNASGVAATQGGAFGGDRHGIMEAQNNADYMRQAASTSANLRNQGYQNAQNAAMGDVNSMNQQRGVNAQAENAARMTNAASANDRSQFMGSLASGNEMAAQQANLQAATSASNAATGANAQLQAAMMGQQGQNQRSALEAAMRQQGMQFDAANQAYNMGGDRWKMGQDAMNSMQGVGNSIDQQQQSLIDKTRADFERLAGAPQDQYSQMLAALSSLTGGGTTTESYNPGAFDFLKAGSGLFGMGK